MTSSTPDMSRDRDAMMTLADLRESVERLAHCPGDLAVVVHAQNADLDEIFAGLKSVGVDATCDEVDVVRLFADQTEAAL